MQYWLYQNWIAEAMPNAIGPNLADVKNEVNRQKALAKAAGVSVYYLEGEMLIEEKPDGSKHQSLGPDHLPCVTKLQKRKNTK
jgi:hypothetical protein